MQTNLHHLATAFFQQGGGVHQGRQRYGTYTFPTPSYTFVSAGNEATSDAVNCSMRPSRVRAAFCWRTIRSCCSAKAFFWLISCSICIRQLCSKCTWYSYYIPSALLHFAPTSCCDYLIWILSKVSGRTEGNARARVKPLGSTSLSFLWLAGIMDPHSKQQSIQTYRFHCHRQFFSHFIRVEESHVQSAFDLNF